MSYFNKHLKPYNFQNIENIKANANPYYVNKFKKSQQNKSKVIDVNNSEQTYRPLRNKDKEDEHIIKQHRKQDVKQHPKPIPSKELNIPKDPKYKVGQFATQNPNSHSDSMSRQLQNLMMDTDNSMQQLLNSSINQFTRYLQDKDNFYEQHNQLIQQNQYLKTSLDQLKNILKEKLQNALKKQKDELTLMMQDYIKLITKLLKDKQELTANLQELERHSKQKTSIIDSLQKCQKESKSKIEELNKDREVHIANTKKQIDDFLKIIYQYQQETEQQSQQAQELKAKIQELQDKLSQYERGDEGKSNHQLNSKIINQNNKIQTLISLLERSQQENHILKDSLRNISQSSDQTGQIQEEYKLRLEQIERQHEEQFIQFQRAVRETISKKDECIQRLNRIIQGYRIKRHDFENSLRFSQECN